MIYVAAALILLALATVSASILLRPSRLSSLPSPTPTSTPSTPSDPSLEMAKMMMTMATEQMTQATKLMEIMMVGREPGPAEATSPHSLNLVPTEFDYDSTPLSPGIENVLAREGDEDQLQASLKERAVLQERIRELQDEQILQMDRDTSEQSSPGPWLVPEVDTDAPM